MTPTLITILWANIAWFGCVYSAKYGLAPWSLLIPVGSWWLLVRQHAKAKIPWPWLLILALVGMAFDALSIRLGWLLLPSPSLLPWWLVALWLHFVTLLPTMKPWLAFRPWLAWILGAVFGPLTYRSGAAFGVLEMSGEAALIAYAIFWGAFLHASMAVLKRSSP